MHCSFLQSVTNSARPFGALLEIFACFAPLSVVSRGRLLDFLFCYFFFVFFFLPCFVGTRGYVKQRRVITLNNVAACRPKSRNFSVPTDADRGLIEKQKSVSDMSIDATRVRWIIVRSNKKILTTVGATSDFDV